MLAPVSVGLKFGFLIVLYLFLIWVAWSAMRDMRRGRGTVVRSDGETVRPGTAICGTNPTSPNASQFARIVRSASAAPSM